MTSESKIEHQLVDQILDSSIICILNNDFNISYANNNFCQLTGFNENEVLGKNLLNLKYQEQSNSIYDFLIRTIKQGEVWKGELQLNHKDHHPIWLDTTINPAITDTLPDHYIASFLDISHRKKLIDNLKQRAHRQGIIAILGQLSLNNIPVIDLLEQTLSVICGSLDISTGLILELAINGKSALVRAGYNTSHVIPGKTVIDINKNSLLDFTLSTERPVVCESLSNEQRFNIPEPLLNENLDSATCILIGDKKYPFGIFTLLSNSPMLLNIDEVHFLQSICNILAEAINRQNMEQAIRYERELSRKYLDVAEVIILVIDTHERILLANKHAANVLGCNQMELTGLNFIDSFIPKDIRDMVRSNFTNMFHQKIIAHDPADLHGNITPILNKQKKVRQIKWKHSFLFNDNNEIISLLSAGEDITELLAYEDEQKRLEKQLNQAQKMEAIGMLAGGIAHDFNNILASILGFSELSLERLDPADKKLHEYITLIQSSGIKARDIIEQMQNINLQDDTSTSTIILPTLLKNTLKMLRSALPSSIAIHLNINEDLPAVHINAAEFNQLVMQLLINSRNAMNGKGDISIGLSTRDFTNKVCSSCGAQITKQYAVLSIEDNGPGIEKETIEHLFSHNLKTTSNSGLSIVSNIAHQSNGHLLISSTQLDHHYNKQGTTIELLFEITHEGSDSTEKQLTNIDLTMIQQKHLMIVDDENTVASYLGELFKGTGFKVSVFCDAIDALASFEKMPDEYDLVITDQTMPAITGDVLSSKLLAIRAELPIILCTGHSSIINQEKSKQLNIKGFLKKPVDSAELLHLVFTLLCENQA